MSGHGIPMLRAERLTLRAPVIEDFSAFAEGLPHAAVGAIFGGQLCVSALRCEAQA